MLVSLLIIGGFVGFVNFKSEVAQGTPVSGPITIDTIWNLAGSPYIVTGHVTVVSGVTLTIEPGVEVKFNGGYSLYVDGTIMAVGTDINRINITSNSTTPKEGDWENIHINSNGHAEIKYCNITYGTSGIHLSGSSYNNITNNNISWNRLNGIHFLDSSHNIVADNNISNNGETAFQGMGIFFSSSSDITLTNNNFFNDGIFIEGDQLSHFNTHTIPDNNMVNDKPLYYHKDIGGISIDGIPVGQLILANCTDILAKNLQINNTEVGIEVAYSTNISITNNNISWNNIHGIYLYQFSNSTITDNNVSSIKHTSIYFEWSSNNSIANNNVTSSSAGIYIEYSSNNNTITNNYVSFINTWGIVADNSSNNNIISNNNIRNTGLGISFIVSSSNNTVTDNNVSNNDYGICIGWSSIENVIKRNTILSNNYSVYIWDLSYNNIIVNNNISNGEYGLYVKSFSNSNIMTNNIISNNSCGCFLEESSNNTIINNNISNNGDGIYLHNLLKKNMVKSNTIILNTNNGIYFNDTSDNNITGNYILNNNVGVNISKFSNDNLVRDNTVMNNDYGVYIDLTTSNNLIYHNNIINNTIQAHDYTNNKTLWDNGYPIGGNYWSDFDEPGEDAYDDFNGSEQNNYGSDGIVDLGLPSGGKNPYVIDADSQDNYPLINLTKNFIFLYPGWNLISIPHIQIDKDLGTVLKSIKDCYDTVWWYNASNNEDYWKVNNTSKPPFLNDMDIIDHKMGFWIHITEPYGVLFYYPGIRLIENQTITIHPGWNLIGYPSLGNRIRLEALNNLTFGTEIDSVWTYDAAIQRWDEIGTSDYFEVGRGYWIHSKVEKVWGVPL